MHVERGLCAGYVLPSITLMIYFSKYVVEGSREEHLVKILKNNCIVPFPRINKSLKVISDE